MLRGSVNNTTNPAGNTDANFNQVSLLLHGDGTNGAQNNTFLDSSTNNYTITRNGNTTQGTNTPFSQSAGYWSNYFNGTSDSLTVATNAAFTYGLSDFTMECWVYYNKTSANQFIIDQRNSGTVNAVIPTLYIGTGGLLTYLVSSVNQITGTTVLTTGTWYHVAVSRSTLSTKMFLNGVQEGSTYTDANNYAASRVSIGVRGSSASTYLLGYVSNVRLVNGTGVYTTTFTPSTTPLTAITNTQLLTCQSNYFKDNSSNNFTVTATGTPSVQPFSPFAPTSAYSTSVNGGSMYFDGTGDDLTISSTAFSSTGDFTMECWAYITKGSAYGGLISFRTQGSGNNGGAIDLLNTGNFEYAVFGSGGASYGSTAVPLNQWFHVALVRSGSGTNNCSCYLNGTRVGQFTATAQVSPSNLCVVGKYWADTYDNYTQGYISNVRYVVGTAIYSGTTYTVPTAPLTAITNTSLLLSGTNAGIYDNAIKNDLETVGNAQVSTSVTKFGTGSMSFDGTGDWLTSPDTPNLQLGTGNFTIEGWVYLNAIGSARGFVSKGTSTTGWSLSTNSSNQVVFSYASSTITSTGTLSVSTWYFITVVREGTGTNLTKIYINGTNDGTGTVATDFNQTSIMYVGADRVAGSALNGYIDDLRITKGIARYTTTFTPPTQAFPNQ